jgi:hypothetical protein
MKTILLTQGKKVMVDDEDFEYLNQFRWHFSQGYAFRRLPKKDGYKIIALHRFLLKAPKGTEVDHVNLNKLDCRKSNLRITNRSGNMANTGLRNNNTSGFKGVYFRDDQHRWVAEIMVNYKKIFLGNHKTKEGGARAYNKTAKKYFGDFARLNIL